MCPAPGPAGTALAPTPHTTAPRDGHAVTLRAAEGTGVGGPGSLPGGVWFVAASACRRPGGLSNGHSIPSLEAEVQGHGAGRAPLPGSQMAVPSLTSQPSTDTGAYYGVQDHIPPNLSPALPL